MGIFKHPRANPCKPTCALDVGLGQGPWEEGLGQGHGGGPGPGAMGLSLAYTMLELDLGQCTRGRDDGATNTDLIDQHDYACTYTMMALEPSYFISAISKRIPRS